MKWLVKSLLIALIGISAYANSADDVLRFSYWDDAKPPFIIEKNGVVHSGIIKELADKVSLAAGVGVKFVKLPVARIEPQLQSGLIDIDCLTSPIWKDSPGLYNWSPVLFNGADRFLVRPEFSSRLHSFSDLKGITLGIYNAYVYHPEIMRMIKSGDIETIKVKGVEHGIELLKLKRLDALIDFGVLLKYQIREKDLAGQLVLASLPADEYNLHCAYSKGSKASAIDLESVFQKLLQQGGIKEILNRYQ